MAKWYSRDASFFSRPDTHKLKRVHLVHPHNISRFEHRTALCSRKIPLLDDHFIGLTTDSMKCKRCKKMGDDSNGKN